ncbi:MAG TPA: hypothetical protein VE733_05485 [Streptosporangiaceae bacterium]|nr:hypothetical protein [Streptosporangiaceae bacterium]
MPALWQDNDITLFPGESQTLTVTYDSADLQGATLVISLSGWNIGRRGADHRRETGELDIPELPEPGGPVEAAEPAG